MPGMCALLHIGQKFCGTQNVLQHQTKLEAWNVNVRIQGCDVEHGTVCGSMEALNVPSAESSVVTFWQGEIIDNTNFFFYTSRWDASKQTDMEHWSKFAPFAPLKAAVAHNGGLDLKLSQLPHVFMRWKEMFFVNVGADCGLTIAGFYYVCFDRQSGGIDGFYYDPNSSPFQASPAPCTRTQ